MTENRRRNVQIHFRLTPEENVLFQRQIKRTGLTMTDYLRRLLIQRVGLSAVNCQRKVSERGLKLDFLIGGKSVGYAKCAYGQEENVVSIQSLYVVEAWRGNGIETQLLQEIEDFAVLKRASAIVSYPGPEPFCPGGWIPLDEEVRLYEENGFKQNGTISGVTPRMVKIL